MTLRGMALPDRDRLVRDLCEMIAIRSVNPLDGPAPNRDIGSRNSLST